MITVNVVLTVIILKFNIPCLQPLNSLNVLFLFQYAKVCHAVSECVGVCVCTRAYVRMRLDMCGCVGVFEFVIVCICATQARTELTCQETSENKPRP